MEPNIETKKKWFQKTGWIILLLIFFFPVGLFLMWKYVNWNSKIKWGITALFVLIIFVSNVTNPQIPNATKSIPTATPTPLPNTDTKQGYPSLTEETIDRNFVFSCEGGDEVVLWDKPTDIGNGARFNYRVPCGTLGWAFNKYYNEELGLTFYAVNTNDKRVKNSYGWIIEDFLTWR